MTVEDREQAPFGRLSDQCVYTILSMDKLEEFWLGSGRASVVEGKNWATGEAMLKQARVDGTVVPLLLAQAEEVDPVRYVARLTAIRITKGAAGRWSTKYTFENLLGLPVPLFHSDLIVSSTGVAMPGNYIRPYAICQTPKLLHEWNASLFGTAVEARLRRDALRG